MYKSVIREGKFLVLIADGIFDVPLLELPTEELADKVAYELQTAWDQGVDWGFYQDQRESRSSNASQDPKVQSLQ